MRKGQALWAGSVRVGVDAVRRLNRNGFRGAGVIELSVWFFTLSIPAVLFAGISKGGFGSGAAFASTSILALVLEPVQALALMLPLLMVMDVVALKAYWGKWSALDAKLMILGCLPGVALGVWLFRVADADFLRLMIGVLSIGFVAWQLAKSSGVVRPFANRLPNWAGVLAGTGAGFTSFVSHAGGPPAAFYLLSQKLNKTEYQGTTVIVFWVINIAKTVPYAFLGMFTLQTGLADLVLAPVAFVGVWLGVRAHNVVPENLFFAITYTMLSLTGAKLIWDALM